MRLLWRGQRDGRQWPGQRMGRTANYGSFENTGLLIDELSCAAEQPLQDL